LNDENPQSPQIEQNSHTIELNSLANYSYSVSSMIHTNNISFEQMKEYIKYPMIYNAILREISRQSYSLNGVYGQSIDKMVALPTLSYITTLRNKSQGMKNKKQKFNTLLKILNIDRTTRDILRHLFIDGMFVGVLRDTSASNKNINTSSGFIESIDRLEGLSLNDNFMIQSLDLDYCKIIGVQNNTSIAAFDLMYFDQFKHGGLLNEIKNYPKEFVVAYNQYKKDGSKRWFILDHKKTIALKAKADEDEAFGRPFGISAFADMKLDEDYENSQYKLISELASSIYVLMLPEGEKKGSCSLNKDQQLSVITAFQNAIRVNTTSDSAKISTLSLAPGAKIERVTKDSSLITDTLSNENIKKIATNLGFAASALNAESQSANLGSLQINLDLTSAQVFQYVNEIAREETRVLNNHLGIIPKDFIDIEFLPLTYLNKESTYEKAKELYTLIGGSRRFLIAAAGFNTDSYLNCLDEEIELGYEEMYPAHITAYTSSDSADKSNPDNNLGGRPKKDSSELKQSGITARNLKSNEQKVKDKK
jgi:hypothetical protein